MSLIAEVESLMKSILAAIDWEYIQRSESVPPMATAKARSACSELIRNSGETRDQTAIAPKMTNMATTAPELPLSFLSAMLMPCPGVS